VTNAIFTQSQENVADIIRNTLLIF